MTGHEEPSATEPADIWVDDYDDIFGGAADTTRQNQHADLPRYELNRRSTVQSIANIGHWPLRVGYYRPPSSFAMKTKAARRRPEDGVPKGIRTPVTAVKGPCPRPLDDGDLHSFVVEPAGVEPAASTMPL